MEVIKEKATTGEGVAGGRDANAAQFTPNYPIILNCLWQDVPFIQGYKGQHALVFMAILDSINRNYWRPVNLPLDYILNKIGYCRKVYTDSRNWLVDNGLLVVVPGKNANQMARFELGPAVHIWTATWTAREATTDTANPVLPAQIRTGTDTHLKTGNNKKTVNNKQKAAGAEKEVINPFPESFLSTWQKWKDYKSGELRFKFKTVISEQTALDHLFKLSGGNEVAAAEIIEQSIANNWKGLFPLNSNKNEKSSHREPKRPSEYVRA